MPATLHILDGPNLNRLGLRRPGIYGAVSLGDVQEIVPHDAIRDSAAPAVEVLPSNVFGREAFGPDSRISPVAKDAICGFGLRSDLPAIDALAGLQPGA